MTWRAAQQVSPSTDHQRRTRHRPPTFEGTHTCREPRTPAGQHRRLAPAGRAARDARQRAPAAGSAQGRGRGGSALCSDALSEPPPLPKVAVAAAERVEAVGREDLRGADDIQCLLEVGGGHRGSLERAGAAARRR